MGEQAKELVLGRRFEFAKDCSGLLEALSKRIITQAEHPLKQLIGVQARSGDSFFDIGLGGNLFGLSTRRLTSEETHFPTRSEQPRIEESSLNILGIKSAETLEKV